tara:strand:- start:188 stop:1087 length:900 start_codon:yes stop_codon:yes gene_type:complete
MSQSNALHMFVTEELKSAVDEAKQFEKNEIYTKSMCLKPTKGGVKVNTFEEALESAKEYMTTEDVFFYKNFYKHFSTPKCVLPKGHSGPCTCSYGKFFAEQYAKKIKDCDTTPGDDDILFKNRARRCFPLQVNKKQYTVLNDLYKWKASKIKMKAAIPMEFGGTNFTIATAHFDLAAILMLQKGVEHTLPKDIEEKLLDRAQDIVVEFMEQGIRITDKDGNLRCPLTQKTIEPEWYLNRDDDFQIQFGHVIPVKSNKYMTRGGNLLPITRLGNLMQSNRSITDTYDYIAEIKAELDTFR